jgi:hypothetical protein
MSPGKSKIRRCSPSRSRTASARSSDCDLWNFQIRSPTTAGPEKGASPTMLKRIRHQFNVSVEWSKEIARPSTLPMVKDSSDRKTGQSPAIIHLFTILPITTFRGTQAAGLRHANMTSCACPKLLDCVSSQTFLPEALGCLNRPIEPEMKRIELEGSVEILESSCFWRCESLSSIKFASDSRLK